MVGGVLTTSQETVSHGWWLTLLLCLLPFSFEENLLSLLAPQDHTGPSPANKPSLVVCLLGTPTEVALPGPL